MPLSIVSIRCLGLWSPIFTDYNGVSNVQVPNFWYAIGIPQCGNRQIFTINHDPTVSRWASGRFEYFFIHLNISAVQSRDRLALLPDGKLRHYIQHPDADDVFDTDDGSKANTMWDYAQGKYCMDKVSVSIWMGTCSARLLCMCVCGVW